MTVWVLSSDFELKPKKELKRPPVLTSAPGSHPRDVAETT